MNNAYYNYLMNRSTHKKYYNNKSIKITNSNTTFITRAILK